MSVETTAWAKIQRCGCPHTKSVLRELANWARPDGICEFRKISDIAFVTELSERTVQRCLKKLETAIDDGGLGLIRRLSRIRKDGGSSANGFELVGYAYPGDTQSPPRVTHSHPPGCLSVTPPVTDRRGGGCQPDTPYKDINQENNNTPLTPHAGGRSARRVISDDWAVPGIDALPEPARSCAALWPAGAYAAQGKAFILHHRGTGSRRSDWDALWAARVVHEHPRQMRDAKAGVNPVVKTPAAPPAARLPSVAKRHEDEKSVDLHERLAGALGIPAWNRWFEATALVFEDDCLTVCAPTEFQQSRLESDFRPAIEEALSHCGHGVEVVRFKVVPPKGRRP